MVTPGYSIRPFVEADRPGILALGLQVIDWWNEECPTLHRVVEVIGSGEIAAQLQIADRTFPKPSRRPGECQMRLTVAPAHRNRGLGSALYSLAEGFARERGAKGITASYFESPEGAPARRFLTSRGFVPYECYCPSHLELSGFHPEQFAASVERVERVRFLTYAEAGDSPEHRRRLYNLECAARSVQPFREVGNFIPPPYEKWEEGMVKWRPETIFLAAVGDEWVGMISGLVWGFTGVHPSWQGRGVATALKVLSLAAAKTEGLTCIETENHEDNRAMLAINRKLGFVPDAVEVNCIRRL